MSDRQNLPKPEHICAPPSPVLPPHSPGLVQRCPTAPTPTAAHGNLNTEPEPPPTASNDSSQLLKFILNCSPWHTHLCSHPAHLSPFISQCCPPTSAPDTLASPFWGWACPHSGSWRWLFPLPWAFFPTSHTWFCPVIQASAHRSPPQSSPSCKPWLPSGPPAGHPCPISEHLPLYPVTLFNLFLPSFIVHLCPLECKLLVPCCIARAQHSAWHTVGAQDMAGNSGAGQHLGGWHSGSKGLGTAREELVSLLCGNSSVSEGLGFQTMLTVRIQPV